jgi:hypothetical protein
MKLFFSIAGIALVIGVTVAFFLRKDDEPSPGVGGESPPTTGIFNPASVQPIPNQPFAAGTQPDIARAFFDQTTHIGSFAVEGTSVSSMYALQDWGNEYSGGEALFEYRGEDGWRLVSMGGGVWSVEGLIAIGVPASDAKRLLEGRE